MNQEKIEMLNSLNERHELFTEQLRIVEQQIKELLLFDEELTALQNKSGEEILAPIGKSVFAPVKFDSKNKLLVEIGAGYFVKKNIDEAKKITLDQRQRLESFKLQISSEIESISIELEKLII